MTDPATVLCPRCGGATRGPSPTFLGFQRHVCASCSAKVVRPLWPLLRVLYGVILGGALVESVRIVRAGSLPIPGALALVSAYALVRDHRLRSGPRSADQRAPMDGSVKEP